MTSFLFSGHTIRLENVDTTTFEPSRCSTMWPGTEILMKYSTLFSISEKVELFWTELEPYQLQIGQVTIQARVLTVKVTEDSGTWKLSKVTRTF